ncbi:putative sulfate exporter family transporter, partial [Limosilactobacillus fermentum]
DFRPGINYSAKKLLHYSIIALGFTMSFAQVSQTGASSFPVTIVTISIAFLTALFVGNFFKLSRPLKILVGFGTAICGGSAIAAASPIIKAEDD